ncbi:DUF4402 domain-containing protein [Gillisia hiemivivida]|uniref:DUF4402 domain-containing protein n=1 Tax=Gillisia hiemivivida TaxID=291190 RepID=A0A5C6ZT71_9FLAO|nr:DUF4402 domain-containing protein [Gillisia hiemivivida]TXD94053.1 DUF4402 domain-containing protein [Gillisia hiemivivida]
MYSFRFCKKYFWLLPFMFSVIEVSAQENPPIPIEVEVRAEQFLNFGAFTVGTNGGTVRVTSNGTRIANNDIYLMNMGATHTFAIFDVYANPGTIIQIQPHLETTLSGPSGSDVRLRVDIYQDVSTGPTFIVTKSPKEVIVGGSLHIDSQAAGPPGSYNGNLHLTFIHQ